MEVILKLKNRHSGFNFVVELTEVLVGNGTDDDIIKTLYQHMPIPNDLEGKAEVFDDFVHGVSSIHDDVVTSTTLFSKGQREKLKILFNLNNVKDDGNMTTEELKKFLNNAFDLQTGKFIIIK